MKAEVYKYYIENRERFKSGEAAAEAILKATWFPSVLEQSELGSQTLINRSLLANCSVCLDMVRLSSPPPASKIMRRFGPK